jgi:hypothetical protein
MQWVIRSHVIIVTGIPIDLESRPARRGEGGHCAQSLSSDFVTNTDSITSLPDQDDVERLSGAGQRYFFARLIENARYERGQAYAYNDRAPYALRAAQTSRMM